MLWLVVVKWSACLPSTLTICVRIPLTATVFSLKFVFGKNESKQKRSGTEPRAYKRPLDLLWHTSAQKLFMYALSLFGDWTRGECRIDRVQDWKLCDNSDEILEGKKTSFFIKFKWPKYCRSSSTRFQESNFAIYDRHQTASPRSL